MIHSLISSLFCGQGHRELLTQEASDETFTQSLIPRGDSEAQPSQVCMSLHCWRKSEYLETTDNQQTKTRERWQSNLELFCYEDAMQHISARGVVNTSC